MHGFMCLFAATLEWLARLTRRAPPFIEDHSTDLGDVVPSSLASACGEERQVFFQHIIVFLCNEPSIVECIV